MSLTPPPVLAAAVGFPSRSRALHWAGALVFVTLGGCGPGLQRPETFTPQRVKAVMYDDECQLQGYFDNKPPPLHPRANQSISANGPDTVGEATFELKQQGAKKRFLRLIALFYKRLPKGLSARTLSVTVRYHLRRERYRLPIGAQTRVDLGAAKGLGPDSFTLPYHPCLGAFFFGQRYYHTRRQLAHEGG